MNETNGEIPARNILPMVDNTVQTCTTGEENITKQQAVKLGAPNAQLILLPPYQPSSERHSNGKLLINAQCQTSQDGNVTSRQCVWQQMCRQQKHNQPVHQEPCIKSSKIIEVLHENSQIQHNENPEALPSPIYEVHNTCYHKKSQPSRTKCLHTLPSSPSDIHLILEQSKVIENINASVLDLKTSHGNMNQLLMNIQQQVIEAQAKVENTVIGDNGDDKHNHVFVQSNNSMVSLDVSDQQLSEVYKYVNQCEDVLKNTEINKQRLKPWRVVDVLSNQVVDSALRSVVTELDFESLLSNMYRLEFQ